MRTGRHFEEHASTTKHTFQICSAQQLVQLRENSASFSPAAQQAVEAMIHLAILFLKKSQLVVGSHGGRTDLRQIFSLNVSMSPTTTEDTSWRDCQETKKPLHKTEVKIPWELESFAGLMVCWLSYPTAPPPHSPGAFDCPALVLSAHSEFIGCKCFKYIGEWRPVLSPPP